MQNLIEIPFCDTHGTFIDTLGRKATNPNELVNETTAIDENAVFSMLQFGAIIPPLSPWQGIQRLMPGYQYDGTKLIGPVEILRSSQVAAMNDEQQADEMERLVDHALKQAIGEQKDPVLLFSGGVDSSFMASRLATLGYRDCLLLNYSFYENDHESLLAEAIAKHLGLRFERVSAKRNLCESLIQPGRVYSQPFGDHSAVPTSDLGHAVIDRLAGENRIILDGTGADGAFGMMNKINIWNRILLSPKLFRQAASYIYSTRLWSQKGKVEFLFRILRRSADMPLLSAVLARNPLAGMLYHNSSRNVLDQLLEDWVAGCVGESLPHQIVAADLALICSNIFAQKAQPILESAGHQVVYPFLQNESVATAMASINNWQFSEPKAPLKRSLARYIPKEMVYRAKSGFVDPRGNQVFSEPEFIEYLRATIDNTGPIAFTLNKKLLLKACDLLSRNSELPSQTRHCLWAITFADRWYRTARY